MYATQDIKFLVENCCCLPCILGVVAVLASVVVAILQEKLQRWWWQTRGNPAKLLSSVVRYIAEGGLGLFSAVLPNLFKIIRPELTKRIGRREKNSASL
jgi:hypothetical protein